MATERITAPKVNADLQRHLQTYNEKVAPKLHDVHIAVFGERGKGGLCADMADIDRRVEDLEKIKAELSGVKWAVVIAIAVNVALRFLPA